MNTVQDKVKQWESKKAYSENELTKIGVSSEELFQWRVDVMVDFSRLKMKEYEFRQSILGEKAYTDLLFVNIVIAEYQMLMNVCVENIDYGFYANYILTLLGKAHTSYSITEIIVQIIQNRKLKEKQCKRQKK
jgi:hypothetical protein